MSAREAPCANAWEEVTLQVEWALTPGGTARLEIGTPSRQPPLSSGPTSVWRQPYLSVDLPGRQRAVESFWSSGVLSMYMLNALMGHSNAKARSASSEGSACRFTTWLRKGRGGNLGHVSRPGSQDNVRVGWPENEALFAYQKCLKVPDPFDGSEHGQERCLGRQEFQLDWVQWLQGAPLKSSQDYREVPRGHKGWPRGIHPHGTLQEPHDELMLSQGQAVHCIVVGRDSGHIHFQGGGWQPTLQIFCRKESTTSIMHLRGSSQQEEHQFVNRLHLSA